MSASSLLTLVETVIERRLNGDAYESYTEAEKKFQGTSLKSLMDTRDRLSDEVANDASDGTYVYEMEEPC